jgi:hypothetical protein
MGNTSKVFCIILATILAASSLIISANAQTVPKPSVPEFTVRIADYSYDIPPTTPTFTIDPYSGEQEQLTYGSDGYRVANKSIEFTIKNQPFTPYNDSNGGHIGLYYNFRYKGHYGTESDWAYYPFNPDGLSSQRYGGIDFTYLVPYEASDSEYTIVSMDSWTLGTLGIPDYGGVDFQVQAQIGYIFEQGDSYSHRVWGDNYNFTGESSNWSNTQTISFDENTPVESPTATPLDTESPITSTSPSEEPSVTPQTPINRGGMFNLSIEQTVLVIAFAVIAVLAVAVLVLLRKVHSKNATSEGVRTT